MQTPAFQKSQAQFLLTYLIISAVDGVDGFIAAAFVRLFQPRVEN